MAAASPVLPYPINFLPDSINSPGYLHPRISHPNMMPNLGGQPSVAHTFDSSNNCPKSTLPVSSPFVASKPPGSGKRCREPVDQKDQAYDSPFPEEDGRKKRSRGRPRLDTKDETAADVSIYRLASTCALLLLWAPGVRISYLASAVLTVPVSVDGRKSASRSVPIVIAKTRPSPPWSNVSRSWSKPMMT